MGMRRIPESDRLHALTAYERPLWAAGIVAGGMDEVGRGPLAGPVVAAVAVLPPEPLIEGVNDSKKLSEAKRMRLSAEIRDAAIGFGFGWVFPDVIDGINILQATYRAFALAYENMGIECGALLMDALTVPAIPVKQHSIIHGDASSYLIAAASIIAKVERDEYMIRLDGEYPMYGFAKNKGYGTPQHIEALREYGPCPYHRRSFIRSFCGDEP